MNAQRRSLRRAVRIALATAAALALVVAAAFADAPPFSALTSVGAAGYLTEHDGVGVFIAGCDGVWQSDGTAAGTHASAFRPIGFADYGRRLAFGPDGVTLTPKIHAPAFQLGNAYYFADQGVLWKSDGTDAGTVQLGRFPAPWGLGDTFPVFSANGVLYVEVLDEITHYAQLWAGDGSVAGSRDLTDLSGKYPDPHPFLFHGLVYFSSYGLWSTDGTPEGTREVSDYLGGVAVFGDRIYGFGGDGHLWRSDGTAAGTAQVTDSPHVDLPDSPTVADGAMYFTSSDSDGTIGVWRSDGTGPGTVELGKIPIGSFPEGANFPLLHGMAVLHGDVYLSVDDGDHGAELWMVPGAGGPGRLLEDLIPGRVGSDPRGLTVVGDHLLFVATDPSGGSAPNTMANLYVLPAQDGAPVQLTPWSTCLQLLTQPPPSTGSTASTTTPTTNPATPPPQHGASTPPTERPTVGKLRAVLAARVRATGATVVLGTARCPPLCGRLALKLSGAAVGTTRRTLGRGAAWRVRARLTRAARRALAHGHTPRLYAALTLVTPTGTTLSVVRTIAVVRGKRP